MYLLLWNIPKGEWCKIFISDNPEVRSMERLFLRLIQNTDKFTYFMTLTFTDTNNGYFPIKDRYLESKLQKWTKNKEYYPYKDHKTLLEIHWKYGITSYMRTYINKLKSYMRKYKLGGFSYCWKYEIGGKTNRPHIHMFTSSFGTSGITKYLWENLEKRWNSGYVDITEITDPKKCANYLYSYVKKTNVSVKDRFREIGKKRWALSRDIPKRETSKDYVYYDMFQDYEIELLETIIATLWYDPLTNLWECK